MRKMLRSARRGSSRVAMAARYATQSSILSPGGIYLGNLLSVPLEDERVQRIFSWLTRGAYFYLMKQRIPDDYTFKYLRLDRTYAGQSWELFAARIPVVVQGAGVFGCTAMTLDSDPFTSIWLLGFYQWLETANLAGMPPSREYMPFYDRGITYQVEVSKPGSGLDWEDA
jgi:hypothetical protein